MTLSNFKKNSKLSVLSVLLLLYGGIFYLLGTSQSSVVNFIRDNFRQNQKTVENSIERPLPYADTQSGSVISSYVKLCSNTFYGFELSYPKDWFTTYDSEDQKCTLFAPFSFVINTKADNVLIPIRVEVVSIDQWLDTVKFYENPNDFQNIQTTQNILLNDKSVKKIEAISTGFGLIPKGLKKISYLILDSETPLVIYYQQNDPTEDTKNYEKIVEELVGSLRYF